MRDFVHRVRNYKHGFLFKGGRKALSVSVSQSIIAIQCYEHYKLLVYIKSAQVPFSVV